MYLKIGADGGMTLEETDDFSRFHISAAPQQVLGPEASEAFTIIAETAGDNHFWLDAVAVAALAERPDDEAWQSAFQQMLEKAEPYGFADTKLQRIKAHLA